MTAQELQKVLLELRSLPGETEVVEFKEATNGYDFNKLGKYFSALSNEANLKGKPEAWLLFGVENQQRNIVGSNYRPNRVDLDSLKNEVANKTTNRITFIEIHELIEPDGRVVMFQIPAAPAGIPVAWNGHYYGRDGESLAPLNLEEIERIRQQGTQQDWSAEICKGATLDDLDRDKVEQFIAIAREKRGFPLQPSVATEAFLAQLGLIRNEEICNAAVLAFAKKPQFFFPTAITKCARFHGLSVEKPIPAHQVFHGDVFEQVDKATDFILSKIDTSVGMRTESAQAPIRYEIPRPIVFEAIVNAIAHRDYTSKASVQVMLFADRLEIYNPGHLTPSLSIDQLQHEHASYPTNPKLAELLYQLGYIERFGTGTKEIFKLAQEANLQEPKFDFTREFTIIIWRPADANSATQQHRTSTVPVPHQYRTSTEINMLVAALQGEMNRSELQKELKLKHKASFLQNYIQPAIEEGFIELTVPDKPNSPKQKYRLTPKGLELQKQLSP